MSEQVDSVTAAIQTKIKHLNGEFKFKLAVDIATVAQPTYKLLE